MASLGRLWPPKLSHVWLLLCNLGIFALTICILASCRSTAESNYSLLHYDRTFLQKIIGAECHDATKGIAADVYRLGLSGSCREIGDDTVCEGHKPKLEWITLFEADIAAANVTDDQGTVLDQCLDTLNKANVDHDHTSRLAAALFAFLIISTLLNACALVAAVLCGSGFGLPVFFIGLADEVIMVTCLGIFLGIINHEMGRYIPASVNLGDIDDKAALGVGFWFLVAIFVVRVISHPLLLALTIAICVLIILIPIFLILCCLGGGGDAKEYVQTKVVYVYGTTQLDKDSIW